MVGLLGRGIGPSQGLYLHRTAEHMRSSVQSVKDRTCPRSWGHWAP